MNLSCPSAAALPQTRAVVFNVALCDFAGEIGDVASGKYAERLQTRAATQEGVALRLRPTPKVLRLVKELRPDVLAIGFKTTCQEEATVQVERAQRMANEHALDFVLANDVGTRTNIVLRRRSPEGKPTRDARGPLDWTLYAGTHRETALGVLASSISRELEVHKGKAHG